MTQQLIGVGTTANDGTGDKPRPAGQKINANFTELYGRIGKERTVSGTADTPTATDDGALLLCTSSSAVTITVNDLGAKQRYAIQQRGTGQVEVVPGTGVTLISDKAAPSFKTARRGAVIGIMCTGSGEVFVVGNTE